MSLRDACQLNMNFPEEPAFEYHFQHKGCELDRTTIALHFVIVGLFGSMII